MKKAPILPGDSKELGEQITQLTKLGYYVHRHTKYHVKVDNLNWYPGKGTITDDSGHRFDEKGFAAFVKLLKPKKTRACGDEIEM